MRVRLGLVFSAIAGLALASGAQQQEGPMRGARLSYVGGKVTVDNGPDSLAGQVNMPIGEGYRVSTGDDGQAEVEFEDGSVLRLTPASSAVLNELDFDKKQRAVTQIGLMQGLFYLDLRVSDQVSYAVDAAGERITPQENSVLRIKMDEPPAEVGILQGKARVERDGGFHTSIRGGESLRGDAEDASRYFLAQNLPTETWDRWNEDREQEAANEANLRTDAQVASGDTAGYGWSDLDAYGNWYDLPGEGRVWQPEAVAADFDPYGYGSWVDYPGRGYVWVSGYPWGWTPFRCGNWNYYGSFGWGWQPAGCRTWNGAWGDGGGIFIRIQRPPRGYRYPVRPPAPRGVAGAPPRKIIPVGSRPPIQRVTSRDGMPVMVNGQALQPLPRHNGYTQRGGSAVGSGLRRDFPVDSRTQQPVMGVAPSQPNPTITPGAGWRPVGSRKAPAQAAQPPAAQAPGTTQQSTPEPVRGVINSPRLPMTRMDDQPVQRGTDGRVVRPQPQPPTQTTTPPARSGWRREPGVQPQQGTPAVAPPPMQQQPARPPMQRPMPQPQPSMPAPQRPAPPAAPPSAPPPQTRPAPAAPPQGGGVRIKPTL